MAAHGSRLLWILAMLFGFSTATYGQSQAGHSVNPDGSFSYSIPIEVPPGIRGVQPDLALVYNSSGGNGMLGMGWTLEGLPTISRMNYGVGINYTGNDTYAGPAGRLVDISSGAKTLYASEMESWGRYVPSGTCGDGPCSWLMTDKSGNKWHFGDTSISPNSRTPAYYFSAQVGPGSVRVWALSRFEDQFGNGYDVNYAQPAGAAMDTEYYPKEILYTANPAAGISAGFKVTFTTEDRHDDARVTEGRATVGNTERLSTIQVEAGSTVLRTYTIPYETGESRPSRIAEVRVSAEGSGDALVYSVAWSDVFSDNTTFTNHNTPFSSLSDLSNSARPILGDFNGDGLQDILWWQHTTGNNRFYKNNGDGTFTRAANNPIPAANIQVTASTCPDGVSLCYYGELLTGDFNGDGITDLVFWNGMSGTNRWYLFEPSASISLPTQSNNNRISVGEISMKLPYCPSGDCPRNATAVHVGDWNADGLSDFLFWDKDTGENRWYTANAPTVAAPYYTLTMASKGELVTRDDVRGDADYNMYFGDWSGDGWTDFMIFSGVTGTNRWFRNKRGAALDFAAFGVNLLSTSTLTNSRLILGDYNGDGITDVLAWRQSNGANTAWYTRGRDSSGDLAFSSGQVSVLTPSAVVGQSLYAGDWDGDGKTDVLWWDPGNGANRWFTSKGTASLTFARRDDVISTSALDDYPGLLIGEWMSGKPMELLTYSVASGSGSGAARYLERNGETRLHVSTITNPQGGSVAATYTPVGNVPGAANVLPTECEGDTGYSQPCGTINTGSRHLVTALTLDGGNLASPPTTTAYAYHDGRQMAWGGSVPRVNLGFRKLSATDGQTNASTVTTYLQNHPLHGRPDVVEHRKSASQIVATDTTLYADESAISGVNDVRVKSVVNMVWVDGAAVHGLKTDTMTYDGDGNLVSSLSCEVNAAETCVDAVTLLESDYAPGTDRLLTKTKTQGGVVLDAWTYEYDPSDSRLLRTKWRWLGCVVPADCSTGYQHWSQGSEDWVPVEHNIAYDTATGNVQSAQDAMGRIKTLTLDPTKRFVAGTSQTIDKGQDTVTLTTATQYDAYGRVTHSWDFNQRLTKTVFDGLGRKAREEFPNGAWRTYAYNNWGSPTGQHVEITSLLDPVTGFNSWERHYIDGFGFEYKTEREGDGGQVIVTGKSLTYANNQRIVDSYLPHFAGATRVVRRVESDSQGRVVRELRPAAEPLPVSVEALAALEEATYSYGAASGRVTRSRTQEISAAPAIEATTTHYTDARGRVVQINDAKGKNTFYGYDAAGRLRTVTLPNTHTLTIATDTFGRKLREIDPALGLIQFQYDEVGNLLHRTDYPNATPSGTATGVPRTAVFTYDEGNRVLTKTTADGVVTYSYDAEGVYNSQGRLTKVEDLWADTTISYDVSGRPQVIKTDPHTLGRNFVESRQYDALGRLVRKFMKDSALPGETTVEYAYSLAGNLVQVKLNGLPYATYSDFDAGGRMGKKVTNTGVSGYETTSAYVYELDGRLQTLKTMGTVPAVPQSPTDGDVIQDLHYTFDKAGNVTNITDERETLDYDEMRGGAEVNTHETQSFQYDALGRLLSATGTGGTGLKQFLYDDVGNITRFGGDIDKSTILYIPDGHHITQMRTPAAESWMTPQGNPGNYFQVDYDSLGNVASKMSAVRDWQATTNPNQTPNVVVKTWAYAYDAENRLKQVNEGGNTLSFTYDYLGQRVRKVSAFSNGNITTTYAINGWYELRQRASESGSKRSIHVTAPGYGRVAMVTEPFIVAVAWVNPQALYAVAGMYDPTTWTGLKARVAALVKGASHEGKLPRMAALGLIAAFAALLLVALARSLLVGRAIRRERSRFPLAMRLAASILAVAIFATSCAQIGEDSNHAHESKLDRTVPPLNGPGEPPYYGPMPYLAKLDPDGGPVPGTFYYHTSHIGSSSVVTDAHGVQGVRILFFPFGEINQNASVGDYRVTHDFTGQERDPETDLMYYQSRMYDPSSGRFTSADTVLPGGGMEPEGLNRYAYVKNNPINYTDPSGHSWFSESMKKLKRGWDEFVRAAKPLLHAAVSIAAMYASKVATAYCVGVSVCGRLASTLINTVGHALIEGRSLADSLTDGWRAMVSVAKDYANNMLASLKDMAIDYVVNAAKEWAMDKVREYAPAVIRSLASGSASGPGGGFGMDPATVQKVIGYAQQAQKLYNQYQSYKAVYDQYKGYYDQANRMYQLATNPDKALAYMLNKAPSGPAQLALGAAMGRDFFVDAWSLTTTTGAPIPAN